MTCCPNCSKVLEKKNGKRKFCAQIGNPEIAIVETSDPHFCNSCNEYFLDTESIVDAIFQVGNSNTQAKKDIVVGIYK